MAIGLGCCCANICPEQASTILDGFDGIGLPDTATWQLAQYDPTKYYQHASDLVIRPGLGNSGSVQTRYDSSVHHISTKIPGRMYWETQLTGITLSGIGSTAAPTGIQSNLILNNSFGQSQTWSWVLDYGQQLGYPDPVWRLYATWGANVQWSTIISAPQPPYIFRVEVDYGSVTSLYNWPITVRWFLDGAIKKTIGTLGQLANVFKCFLTGRMYNTNRMGSMGELTSRWGYAKTEQF